MVRHLLSAPFILVRHGSPQWDLVDQRRLRGGTRDWRPWEPLSSVRRRVLAVLRRYQHEQGTIVVCHGVVIKALTGKQLSTGEFTTFEPEADVL